MEKDFQVDRIVVGQLQSNCYFVIGERNYIIIDPGDDAQKIIDHAGKISKKPMAIVCTHAHFDHILAVEAVRDKLKIPFCVHERDAVAMGRMWEYAGNLGISDVPPEPDILLKGNEKWDLGGTVVSLVHTPGHTDGSISLVAGDRLFSGDTLFKESIGRTDLGGNKAQMIESLSKFSIMDPEVIVYPGHGPETSIGDEMENMGFFINYLKTS